MLAENLQAMTNPAFRSVTVPYNVVGCHVTDRMPQRKSHVKSGAATLEPKKIAFIGLGRMGIGMAGCLLDAGHQVTVHNRTAAKADPLLARGANWAAGPREAADGADAVFAMLADDDASRSVWLGDEGALAGLSPGAFVIECSTLSHDWVAALSSEAAGCGLRYIDCPVTGLPDAAARGELTLLLGADDTDFEAGRPLLDAVSERIIHFGGVGTGTAYKLMINLMGAVQIAAAAEGLAIAERAGLDLDAVVEALALGQAASPQVVRNSRIMASGDHDGQKAFTPVLRLKDADYGVRLAYKFGLAAPFGDVACNMFRAMCERGLGDENESKVIEIARKNNYEPG